MPSATTITAIREGYKREFTTEVWDQLPAHKYGWQLVADEPEEVTVLKGMVSQADSAKGDEAATPKRKKNAKSH